MKNSDNKNLDTKKSLTEQFKEAFKKVRHKEPEEPLEDNTNEAYDWTPRKIQSTSTSPRGVPKQKLYNHRQDQLKKEKKEVEAKKTNQLDANQAPQNIAEEIEEIFKDESPNKIKNYSTAKRKQLKKWLEQAEKSDLNTDAETADNFNEDSAKPLIGEHSSAQADHYDKNC